MRKFALIIFLALISAAAQAAIPNLLTIPKVPTAPVIDGKLTDSQWSRAAEIPYFVMLQGGKAPSEATEVRMIYTSDALYIAVVCRESQMDKITAEVKKHDDPVWTDDCIEFFFRPAPNRMPYYQMTLNPLGARYDSRHHEVRHGEVDWSPNWKAAAFRGEDFWQLEIEIRFEAFGVKAVKPGDAWAVNICRAQRPKRENSAWSQMDTSFHELENFGALVFGDETTPVADLNTFLAEPNGVIERAGEVRNPTAKPITVRLDTRLAGEEKHRVFTCDLEVDPRAAGKFKLSDETPREGNLTAVAEAFLGGRPFYRIARPFYVPPVKSVLASVAVKLKELEAEAVKLPDEEAAKILPAVQALTARREALAKSALWIPQLDAADVHALSAQARDLEFSTLAVGFRMQAQKVHGSSDFIAYAANPWVQLEPHDRPEEGLGPNTAKAIAYMGEKAYAAVNVVNLSDRVLDLRVTPGLINLAGGKGRVPADRIAMHTCVFVRKDNVVDDLIGDALPLADGAGRLVIPVHQTGQMFFIIDTKGLPHGEYSGPIEVCPTIGGPGQKVNLRLTVYPIELPAEPKPWLNTWRAITSISWAKPDFMPYLADAVDHGISLFLISPGTVVPTLNKDGSLAKPIDYSQFDRYLERYRPHGRIMCMYSIATTYESAAKRAGLECMSPEYRAGFIAWFRDWVAHLKGHGLGYDDFAFQILDEPSNAVKFALYMDLGRLAREADPQARLLLTANFDKADQLREISEVTDIWVPHDRNIENETARNIMKATGKEMWVYLCSGDSKRLDPTAYYRYLAWQSFRYDLTGWGYFAHMWWGDRPWESDSTSEKPLGTYSTIYPGPNGPVTSRRWEAFGKGHEDFRALHLLQRLVADAENSGRAEESLTAARKVLDEAKNAAGVIKQMTADGQTRRTWDYLDNLRAQVASATAAL